MLRLMIVDDDINMRHILAKLVASYKGVDLVAEAQSGEESIAIASQKELDIVLMDVDMPGISGVEAAKGILDISPKCAIVFITAHDDYMRDAFELYAFDYIMKPFKKERLDKTMLRLIEEKSRFVPKEKDIEASSEGELIFKVKDGMVLIKREEIILVERENRQTVIVTKGGNYSISKTMQEVEEMLGRKDFIRSHKSYIIRVDAIKTLQVYGRWTYIVKLSGTTHDALLTKEKAKVLKAMYDVID